MRDAMLDLMATMATAVVSTNRAADDLIKAAEAMEGEPDADEMRDHARLYRVEALKLQGKLAGLTNEFVERFGAI